MSPDPTPAPDMSESTGGPAPVTPPPAAVPGARLPRVTAGKAGAAVLVLAALVAGRSMTSAFPTGDRIDAPFVRPGTVEEVVTLRYADVEAGAPTGGTTLEAGGATLLTPGTWLVVPVTITATGEPRDLRYAAIRAADGTLYVAGSGRGGFDPGTAQPGIPRDVDVAVELPVSAVAGAHLELGLDSFDRRRDDVADIDLHLTADDADAWASSDAPLVVRSGAELPAGGS